MTRTILAAALIAASGAAWGQQPAQSKSCASGVISMKDGKCIGPFSVPAEGLTMPDTYSFKNDSSASQWITFGSGIAVNAMTGDVKVPQGIKLSDAAKQFWDAMRTINPLPRISVTIGKGNALPGPAEYGIVDGHAALTLLPGVSLPGPLRIEIEDGRVTIGKGE